jgi:hypothetical protein
VEIEPETKSQTGVGILSTIQQAIGLICFGASGLFAAEVIYEQTLLTQAHGPQMVGFTLAHEHIGFLLLGSAGLLGLYIWIVAFIAIFGYLRIKRGRKASSTEWLQFGASILVLMMFWIPYEWWQYTTVRVAGPGPRAADQFAAAASGDHRYLVDVLMKDGVKVDTPDTHGVTALERACDAGQKPMAKYLVSRGANLGSASSCRRYPDLAARMKPIPSPPDDGLLKVPSETVVVTAAP